MNQQLVSKSRTKKTKSRERQAQKVNVLRTPVPENPGVSILIVLLLWLTTLFIVNAETILSATKGLTFALHLAGEGIFLLITLLATGLFLKIVEPDLIKRNKNILMLATISILSIISSKLIYYLCSSTGIIPLEISQFLLPVAMAPILTTILINGKVAIATGTWTAFVICLIAGHSLPILITGIIATTVAARIIWRVRSRSKVVRISITIGLCQVACVFGTTALSNPMIDALTVSNMAGASILSGVISAIISILILHMFEKSFDVSSDITLLELSDLGHPLLQRLALEAPGTYHHSLIVANLAQAAADEIGANSLLARVASYFHDIGKIVKPNFFTENIQMQPNPHDNIPPSMSTLVISAHVKEGLSLAMLHKLPSSISKIICEHHGTSVMAFFHHKAQTQQELDLGIENTPITKIEDSSFRYPGPKPSSRESAIICIADAVEAASRTIEKTQPSHIEGLINELTQARMDDGQLDFSGLTFGELVAIKRSFTFTLTNMLHGRVPYPKNEDQNKQPTKKYKNQPTGNNNTDTASHDKSTEA
ncbi:MAG: HDIG domain-containing protein [Kiritimatiellae bacterium]|nr:HDIG domain-containing protein [Kiritimatiellia bacterium]